MSIRDKRFSKILNQILHEELQKGNLPSSKEFIYRVNQYVQQHDISKPSLNFQPIRKKSQASSADYNTILDSSYNDLATIYENIIQEHDQSTQYFNKFEVEKSKLDYELDQLEVKLKELILLYSQEGYLHTVYDIFTDFNHIDTAQTNANVDIGLHEVRISDLKNVSKKIIPNATTSFEILHSISSLVTLNPISGTTDDAISDNINSIWQTVAYSKQKIDIGGYYNINFIQRQDINRIVLSLQSLRSVYVRVEITADNVNWSLLPYYESGVQVTDTFTFDFPTITISKIRILLGKNEPDSETIMNTTTGEVNYSYVFGIKNISFHTFKYAEQAELYSNLLDAEPDVNKNFTIDKVSLVTDEQLPNGTDIKYFIALPVESGEPEWKAISPINRKNPQYEEIIDFKNIATSIPTLLSVDPTISVGEYEMENLYTNGIKFYKIGEVVDRDIIDGTERLFVGKDTWGVQYYVYSHADSTTHLPSIADWIKPQNQVSFDYIKIADGKPGLLLNKATTSAPTNYKFTLGVFSTKKQDLVSAIPVSIDPIAIYVNGEMIFQGIPNSSTKVSYLFQNGWNEIIVLSYTRQSATTVNGATIDINFDPRKYGSDIYSQSKPLMKTSLFDLRFNTLNTDYSKYALTKVNNKYYVILNYVTPGLEYEFYYNYIDGTVKDTILFKAILTRDTNVTEISPKLKNYRLRFS